jgi:hypothetical protein
MADLLAIYLDDHRTGSSFGLELARRALRENRGTGLGAMLERLVTEIEEDRRTLEDVMDAVGAPRSRLKAGLAVAAERAGRLKLNGRLLGYSPLSRLLELEALSLGITGKRALWRALRLVDDPRLREFDFAALEARADDQLARLQASRLEAARVAFEATTAASP